MNLTECNIIADMLYIKHGHAVLAYSVLHVREEVDLLLYLGSWRSKASLDLMASS